VESALAVGEMVHRLAYRSGSRIKGLLGMV
jgi:hypothetical protein